MRVFVDPGHGGRDPGAVGPAPAHVRESDVVLAVSRHLERELLARGATVTLSRRQDSFVALSHRAARANTWPADLFVSVHANAATSSAAEGIETWIFPGSAAGRRYATAVQRRMVEAFAGHRDRGIKEAGFMVLSATRMPAILVELEFVSNARMAELLADRCAQQRWALAIALGILDTGGA